jgi:hypothetical protein
MYIENIENFLHNLKKKKKKKKSWHEALSISRPVFYVFVCVKTEPQVLDGILCTSIKIRFLSLHGVKRCGVLL